jgi:hypothetical protein
MVQDDDHSGLFAPIEWQDVVTGVWHQVVSKRVITVQVMHRGGTEPATGAAIRLLPRVGKFSFDQFAIDGFEAQPERAQVKFRILDETDWSAVVRISDTEAWVSYPLTIDAMGFARIQIDREQKVRLLVTDAMGVPAAGIQIELQGRGGETIIAKSDETGRAEAEVQPDTTYLLVISDSKWEFLHLNNPRVKARPESYEIKIAKMWVLDCALEAAGFEVPKSALIACFGPSSQEALFVSWWSTANPKVNANDAIDRAVVLAPGCLPAESQVFFRNNGADPSLHAELKRGPRVRVARAAIEGAFPGPLKAQSTALQVAPSFLGKASDSAPITEMFSSESTPTEGDIVFGPLTPGKYSLKTVDASGKTLWEETREVK